MAEMKVMIASMVLIVAMLTVTAGTCTAAASDFFPEQPQELLPISNILLEGIRGGVVDENSLSCIPIGHSCGTYLKKDCCNGTVCKMGILPGRVVGTCQKCPGRGDSCGLLHKCCSDYHCNGLVFGHCS